MERRLDYRSERGFFFLRLREILFLVISCVVGRGKQGREERGEDTNLPSFMRDEEEGKEIHYNRNLKGIKKLQSAAAVES